MNAPLIQSLNLRIKGVPRPVRIASQIVLSLELHHQKRLLGYEGAGTWQHYREDAESQTRMSWPEYCLQQSGFTESTLQNFFECGEVVRQRFTFSKKREAKSLLATMALVPSEQSGALRVHLIAGIAAFGLTEGDTQAYLKKEYRAAQLPADVKAHIASLPLDERESEERYEKAIRISPVVKSEQERRITAVMSYLRQRRIYNLEQLP